MRYRDGDLILDPEKSVKSWDERFASDGSNRISLATGSQWEHQRLHLTPKGNWWIERWSQRQGKMPTGEIVSPHEACRWLLQNNYSPDEEDFPDQLRPLIDEVLA